MLTPWVEGGGSSKFGLEAQELLLKSFSFIFFFIFTEILVSLIYSFIDDLILYYKRKSLWARYTVRVAIAINGVLSLFC